jgi:DNA end-binding protein Ku
MPDEAVWTGAVNFVLVSIPVQILPAVHEKRVAFRLVHQRDDALLKREMYCPADGAFVQGEHIANGYEVGPDSYVVVTDDEYDALEPSRSQTIQIDSFVNFDEIDPVYFDRSYYVAPREGGERSYGLLVEVMQETRKAGLARFVLHDREHLVALWARNDVLGLMMLHFPEEVADTGEIRPKQAKPQAARVGTITAAIQQLRGDYDPAKYVDEHRERVLGYLQEKAKQQGTVEVAAPQTAEEQPVEQEEGQDLVAALEESLARARAR